MQVAVGGKCAADERLQFGQAAFGCVVAVVDFLPRVIMLVGGVSGAEARVRHVADYRQGGVANQVRNVAAIANVNLVVRIGYGGIGVGGILQLDNASGNTIHQQQHIGNTHLVASAVAHLKLIGYAENILLRVLEVDVLHKDLLIFFKAVESPTIAVEQKRSAEGVVKRIFADVAKVAHNGIILRLRQHRILRGEKVAEVIFVECFRRQTVEFAAVSV